MVKATDVTIRLRHPSGSYFMLNCPQFLAKSGHITCVIGKNGSGKSTLLRALGGIIPIENGIISINDSERNLKRQCTWLEASDVDQLVPFLSVRDHFRAVLGNEDIDIYFRDSPDRTDTNPPYKVLPRGIRSLLSQNRTSRVCDLSTGQRQALRLGMCFLHHRPVILADESTANLDSINGKNIFREFREIVETEEAAAILVTHDLFLASEFADVIYIVAEGCVRLLPECGSGRKCPPSELRECLEQDSAIYEQQRSGGSQSHHTV
jgi:ABC-type lipoprotein export system ATPase subunit